MVYISISFPNLFVEKFKQFLSVNTYIVPFLNIIIFVRLTDLGMRMRLLLLIITAITIVSCNGAKKSETFRVLEDVDSYIEARPDSALAVLGVKD